MESPKSTWRYFRPRFSLRMMFVVFTVFCCCGWVIWQARIVQDRKKMLSAIEVDLNYRGAAWGVGTSNIPITRPAKIPWIRKLLGDRPIEAIALWTATEKEIAEVRAKFPEAIVYEPFAFTKSEAWQQTIQDAASKASQVRSDENLASPDDLQEHLKQKLAIPESH